MFEKQSNKERIKEITAGIEKVLWNCLKVTATATTSLP